jgi:hypothetical protein
LRRNEILAQEFLKPRPEWTGVMVDSLALVYDITPGQSVDIVMCEIANQQVNSISAMTKVIQDTYQPAVDKQI